MIVRISGEGQWRLDDGALAHVNDLEAHVVAAVEADDEAAFQAALAALLDNVRAQGDELADDELTGSDVILPPADTTLDEAGHEFTGEGLIPD